MQYGIVGLKVELQQVFVLALDKYIDELDRPRVLHDTEQYLLGYARVVRLHLIEKICETLVGLHAHSVVDVLVELVVVLLVLYLIVGSVAFEHDREQIEFVFVELGKQFDVIEANASLQGRDLMGLCVLG
jgi:hypothetical protein